MSSSRLLSVVNLLVAFAVVAPAQTPKKIIDDYLHALGDAKTLGQIRTQRITGNLSEESTGVTGSWTQIGKTPDLFYWQIVAGSDTSEEAWNGKSAWEQIRGQGTSTLIGSAAKAAEVTGDCGGVGPPDLKNGKLSIQLLGTETVNGRGAYHLRVTPKPGFSCEIFFDTGTHLIAREISPDDMSFDYSDYRPVQGIQTAFRMELHRGGHNYRISVTRAEYNLLLSDGVFGFPSATAAPLPDIAALFREVSANQKAIELLQKQYTFRLTTESQEIDATGQIKSVTAREFDVFHIAGEDLQHLTAKDGKPLTGDEKKKEDQRFDKQFEELTRKETDLSRDPKKQAKQDAQDEAEISDFLRVERFTSPRRERFRGEDVIAFDFGPNPDVKPKSIEEKMVQKLVGVIWIDDRARDVARVEAHFSDSVKIGAGILASVDKGANFIFEQARVNEEVWLPSYEETHVSARLLFFRGNVNQINRYSDYKKFHAESKLVSTEN